MHNKAVHVLLFCLSIGLLVIQGNSEASDQTAVDKRFESFCKDWLQLKKDFAAQKIKCRKADQGFIAEFDGYSDEFSTIVKVADPVKKVYVGILTYHEVKRQNQAKTQDTAKKGPFNVVSQSRVKEIFMYRNGKWQ